ncbi:MAG: undecaprenol kinase, undecaprenyl-diphosphatase [Candidatus Parcubacteria bacterium]|jgi:undecaprenyl-diphosphatase
MQPLQALILGAVEGLSEFLPISSTGHLILTSHFLGLPETDMLKSFEIAIQLGAICAVAWLYRVKLLAGPKVWTRVAAAFLPTAVIGLAVHRLVKTYLLGNLQVVLWSLLLGGIALVAFERWHKERADGAGEITAITHWQAFWVGVAQAVAIIPGVSRSAATIVGGEALGVKRAAIVEFSFLLAVPTMAAATGLDLLSSYKDFSSGDALALALGFAAAFAVALASVRFMLDFIKTHTFAWFGAYRIAAAILFFLIIRP